jgi:hypothetical protein
VHGLLEKLQPDSISLRVRTAVGTVDMAADDVKAGEKLEEEKRAIEEQSKIEKKRAKKMRGKSKSAHVEGAKVRQMHEAMRERSKLGIKQEYKRAKKEKDQIETHLEFLGKTEGKFDAF